MSKVKLHRRGCLCVVCGFVAPLLSCKCWHWWCMCACARCVWALAVCLCDSRLLVVAWGGAGVLDGGATWVAFCARCVCLLVSVLCAVYHTPPANLWGHFLVCGWKDLLCGCERLCTTIITRVIREGEGVPGCNPALQCLLPATKCASGFVVCCDARKKGAARQRYVASIGTGRDTLGGPSCNYVLHTCAEGGVWAQGARHSAFSTCACYCSLRPVITN